VAPTRRTAGIVLGFGLGGFVDGVVAHQLLEWHHLLSTPYPPSTEQNLRLNMIGDGLFHLACLLVVLTGVALLARAETAMPGDGRRLAGWMLVGWGVFNVVEGLVDHHLLNLHHVRPGPDQLGYDLGFLAFGLLLVLVGLLTARVRRLDS
jgi:uncharacterized membrane protein